MNRNIGREIEQRILDDCLKSDKSWFLVVWKSQDNNVNPTFFISA